MENKFVVMVLNCAHPSGEVKLFLMLDDDENTIVFPSKEDAEKAAKEGSWGPFMCAVVDLSQLNF